MSRLDEIRRQTRELEAMEQAVAARPDRQMSRTDPDARAIASAGTGRGLVGYNLQAASTQTATSWWRTRSSISATTARRWRPRAANVEHGLTLNRCCSSNCGRCALKAQCTPAEQRRVTRREHEEVYGSHEGPARPLAHCNSRPPVNG